METTHRSLQLDAAELNGCTTCHVVGTAAETEQLRRGQTE
jgi:hypothetical protein